jgi:hypothetical protein
MARVRSRRYRIIHGGNRRRHDHLLQEDRVLFRQVSLAARAWLEVRLPHLSNEAAERFTLSWKHVPQTLALMGQAGLKVALRLKSGTAKLRSGG